MATSTLRRALSNPKSPIFHSHLFFYSAAASAAADSAAGATFPSFRAAKSAIDTERDPTKLANIFISQSSSFPAFTRHRPTYDLAVRKLSKANRPDLIQRIVEDQLSKNPSISEGFFIRLLMMYSKAGMIDHALSLFHDLGPRFKDSEKPLCAVLTALLDNFEFDKFHQVFDNAKGKCVTVKAYNMKLKAYCEENKVEMGVELLCRGMEKAGVVPNILSYNVILGAYLKRKNMLEFDSLMKEVLNKGLELNVTSYNHRIARLCMDKECARAKKMLDEMISKGVNPNAMSYNVIIDGFSQVGDLKSAKMVLEKMLKDGYVKPTALSYHTLFKHMVREGEFESGLDTCNEILMRKWEPPFEAMEGLVKGLVGLEKKKEATQIIEKMKKKLQGRAAESWGKIEAALVL